MGNFTTGDLRDFLLVKIRHTLAENICLNNHRTPQTINKQTQTTVGGKGVTIAKKYSRDTQFIILALHRVHALSAKQVCTWILRKRRLCDESNFSWFRLFSFKNYVEKSKKMGWQQNRLGVRQGPQEIKKKIEFEAQNEKVSFRLLSAAWKGSPRDRWGGVYSFSIGVWWGVANQIPSLSSDLVEPEFFFSSKTPNIQKFDGGLWELPIFGRYICGGKLVRAKYQTKNILSEKVKIIKNSEGKTLEKRRDTWSTFWNFCKKSSLSLSLHPFNVIRNPNLPWALQHLDHIHLCLQRPFTGTLHVGFGAAEEKIRRTQQGM